jgi:hypothetical protein
VVHFVPLPRVPAALDEVTALVKVATGMTMGPDNKPRFLTPAEWSAANEKKAGSPSRATPRARTGRDPDVLN